MYAAKYCVPDVGWRPPGLGNILNVWAKAAIAAHELDLKLLNPSWGLNQRCYWRDFGTSRFDWIGPQLLKRVLPSFRFTEDQYRATGEEDFGCAIRVYAERTGLQSHSRFVLVVDGMWGGMQALIKARPFVLSQLLNARNSVRNVYEINKAVSSNELTVAVHVRRGDFRRTSERTAWAGLFNEALPLEWYIHICLMLQRYFENRVKFILLSDGDEEDLRPLLDAIRPLTTRHQKFNTCSDLILMTGADLLICSLSSFSIWAAFLSDAPYVWFLPQLGMTEGYLSIWGHEAAQRGPTGITENNRKRLQVEGVGCLSRGVPIGPGCGPPSSLLVRLEQRLRDRSRTTDLVRYGVVPVTVCDAGAAEQQTQGARSG
jgi:hypothetical protein